MPPRMQGKRVIVIGGSSGIGFAVAQGALADGAEVVIGSSHTDKVERATARLGGKASGATVDVRDEMSVAAFFNRAGAFDHLVFTAGDWGGFRAPRATAELDLASAGDLFTVRFWGAVSAMKHALGGIASDGSITVTNGVVAHRPRKGAPLSTAMAGAIEHLVRGMAVDLAPIRVNVVCPGLVLTEAWSGTPQAERDERLRRMVSHQPLARAADPHEIAEAYLHLMCASYTTGQVLIVDGGRTLI